MEENQQHLYAIEQLCGTQFLIFFNFWENWIHFFTGTIFQILGPK